MSQKEQSSISTAQSPKIITPNKELVGVKKSEPKKEKPVVLEETSVVEKKDAVLHCSDHNRFRKNCPSCLSAVGVV